MQSDFLADSSESSGMYLHGSSRMFWMPPTVFA